MKHLLIPSFLLLAVSCGAATFKYDSINRLTKVEYSPSLTIQYTYDDSGNRTSHTVTDNGRTITVTVPSGGGSVSGGGAKLVGDTATLHALPDAGKQFDYWKENGSVVGYQNPLTFTVTVSRDLEAYFSAIGSFRAAMAGYGLDPEGDGSPSADPDGDGLNNLLEFTLGSDPTVPNPLDQAVSRYETSDGVRYLILDFDYLTTAADFVSISVEYSGDLISWKTAVAGIDGVTLTATVSSPTRSNLRFRVPFSSGRIFARLKITKPGE